jgi:hypothetical protein
MIRQGDTGEAVADIQRKLSLLGYDPGPVDGVFGRKTMNAVKAFQSQRVGPNGRPLVVNGEVGPLTAWALERGKIVTHSPAFSFAEEPPESFGGSAVGRAALRAAIEEMRAGAREEGGNNRGPWVLTYLNDEAPEGSSWCAAFVSWCYLRAANPMPFPYTVGARKLLQEFMAKGWAHMPGSGYVPEPGDVVVWWRVRSAGWQGHAGIVHHVADGMLYTIEGNRTAKVAGFDYVLSRMDKLLGYGHVP